MRMRRRCGKLTAFLLAIMVGMAFTGIGPTGSHLDAERCAYADEIEAKSSTELEHDVMMQAEASENSSQKIIASISIQYPQLRTTAEQVIKFSWNDSVQKLPELVLLCENEDGMRVQFDEAARTEKTVVFRHLFEAKEAGTYKIKDIKIKASVEPLSSGEGKPAEQVAAGEPANTQTSEANDKLEKANDELSEHDTAFQVMEGESENAQTAAEYAEPSQSEGTPRTAMAAKGFNQDGRLVIVLDPGHGGSDAGACANGLKEKNINLKIAKYCKTELEKYNGVLVYMTRNSDAYVSLASRISKAASWKADAFVSLHNNAPGKNEKNPQGSEVWYPNSSYKKAVYQTGKGLSSEILSNLKTLGLKSRGIKTKNSQTKTTYPDGSIADYYYVIKSSKQKGFPGIIVEHAYVTHKEDAAFLKSDANLKKLGAADAKGIADYYGLTKANGAWVETDDGKYAYCWSDGATAVSQWVKYQGKQYFVNSDGERVTGLQTIKKQRFYFDDSGVLQTGKWLTVSGKKYYAQSDGCLATGYQKIGSYFYGFDASGAMLTGTAKIGKNTYKFQSNGQVILYTAKTKTKINYRSGPATKYAKKGSLKKKKTVSIVREKSGWGQMTNGCWIKLSNTAKATKYPTYQVKIKSAKSKYRTGAGSKYKAKGTYKKGKIVTICLTKNGWGKMSNGYWIKLSTTSKL